MGEKGRTCQRLENTQAAGLSTEAQGVIQRQAGGPLNPMLLVDDGGDDWKEEPGPLVSYFPLSLRLILFPSGSFSLGISRQTKGRGWFLVLIFSLDLEDPVAVYL
jgi:hypothetical protein